MNQSIQRSTGRGIWLIRACMVVQLAIFATAASIHFGLLLQGYGHRAAGTAESVIAGVLLLGLVFTWLPARSARVLAIGAQSFATVGVLVGLFTIAIGVGPRTALDLSIHSAMLVALTGGLTITLRVRPRLAAI